MMTLVPRSRAAPLRIAGGLAAASFLIAAMSVAQTNPWTSIGPPGAGDVRALLVEPPSGSIWVGSNTAGVLKSADGGVTWTAVNAGLGSHSVRALVRFQVSLPLECPPPCGPPPVYYAGTADAGVFQGDGTSWTPMNDGLGSLSINCLAVQAGTGQLYAGTLGGVFRWTGSTWVSASSGLTSLSISRLAVASPSADLIVALTQDLHVFRTVDKGATWTPVSLGPFDFGPTDVASDPFSPLTVYVAGFARPCLSPCGAPPEPALAVSTDGAVTWTIKSAPTTLGIRPSPFVPGTLYGLNGFGEPIVRSLDSGATWESLGVPASGDAVNSLETLFVGQNPVLLAGTTRSGVFRSGSCLPSSMSVCLAGNRFDVRASFRTSAETSAHALSITANAGAFWFFDSTNLELVVKVLDGRSVNGKFWVFYGSLTNVEFTLTVTDTLTGAVRTYFNPQGQMASVADTGAF